MEDITCSSDGKFFAVKVVPSFGGAFKNHLALEFSASFPDEYPQKAIENIRLEVLTGDLKASSVQYLQKFIENETSNHIGEPMVFALVEKLKDELSGYNENMDRGLFKSLPNDVLLIVMDYLDSADLARMAQVNRNTRKVSEEDRLWKNLYSKEYRLPEGIEENGWKRAYYEKKSYVPYPLRLVFSIVERKDTGDEWGEGDFRHNFRRELDEKFRITLSGRNSGQIYRSGIRLGYYRFLEQMSVDSEKFRGNPKCPYVGKILGYVILCPSKRIMELIANFMEISRGSVANESDSSYWISCVKLETFRLYDFLNKREAATYYGEEVDTQIDTFDRMGVLVNPRVTKKRVKYLNSLVETVNSILIPFVKRTEEVQKPVEFQVGQKLYPFQLKQSIFGNSFTAKYGELAVSIWVFNRHEIIKVTNSYITD
eukprot:TRINITY_DN1717_c0_g1_i2.p1 TRINITY_DN1717_c0_g1~~TRINITY_DN1717_c0_g1_i2.p1  ORF type:complete len:453 (-),score=88.66 TRINITY_DN1717_c0_g1_i2:181-1461(-)